MHRQKLPSQLALLVCALNAEHQPALADWLNEQGNHPALSLLGEAVSKFTEMESGRVRAQTVKEFRQITAGHNEAAAKKSEEIHKAVTALPEASKTSSKYMFQDSEHRVGTMLSAMEKRLWFGMAILAILTTGVFAMNALDSFLSTKEGNSVSNQVITEGR